MSLLTQNTKIKATSKLLGVKLFNFGIPAYKSASGKLTCPMADKCVDFCYARSKAYLWSNVKPAFERRYELSKTEDFVDAMHTEIKRKKATHIRVHDSGDYYSREYMLKWFKIAEMNPDVRFYSYTNMIKMVKNIKNSIPKNYDFIFSDSGKQVDQIDKENDRHTKIFDSEASLLAEGYADASKNDLYATRWFSPLNKKVGLIFH
jgi:hypothetical protein